jgi:hypothetical protein
MKITIELSAEQVGALRSVDLLEDVTEVCQKAVNSRIKGAFKPKYDKQVAKYSDMFDAMEARGALKDGLERKAFIADYAKELKVIMDAL